MGVGGGKGGGELSVLHTHKKREKLPRYNQSHRILVMKALLELNYSQKITKRAWTRLSITFENLKIYQLEQKIQLSKLWLK